MVMQQTFASRGGSEKHHAWAQSLLHQDSAMTYRHILRNLKSHYKPENIEGMARWAARR